MGALHPSDESDLVAIVASAGAGGERLALRGGGSKADIGAPGDEITRVELAGLAGIVDYDPAELVLTARAGTRLAEIEALVAGEGQMLAFDPFDHGPVFGRAAGAATIGGVVAAGVAGSRRLSAGGARDHLLGFTAVSGRGERFVAGGRVVKNVTGYDLPKLLCGSWGRLAALTELTLKVLPRPRESVTRVRRGLSVKTAAHLMSAAMGSRAGVAAAAHLPGPAPVDARTALRLEGFGPSIAARLATLDALPGGIGTGETAAPAEADAIWRDLRTLAPLAGARMLWRVALPVRGCTPFLATLGADGATCLIDWAGGLIWLGLDGPADAVRAAATAAGGHAMLIRAPADIRAAVPAFHPQPAALAALEARVRRAFDPAGLFETGRFG